MWNFIQELPNNPYFVLILIAVWGFVWFNARRWSGIDGDNPKGWWAKHVASDFPECYHPKCFECNLGNESCPTCKYKRW